MPAVQLYRSVTDDRDGKMELLESRPLNDLKSWLYLKIKAEGNVYAFYYATEEGNWNLLKSGVDGKFLSTKTAGGFVGSMYALYATSSGEKSNTRANFTRFESRSDDDQYK